MKINDDQFGVKKLRKVVKSITTKEQAASAFKYLTLWQKQYPEWIRNRNAGLASAESFSIGYLTGFMKTQNKEDDKT